MDKSKIVKDLFENTDLYLTYDYNLQIRQETVTSFMKNLEIHSVLDMPCGTGTISLPMLEKCSSITLIDISANMVALAKKNIPENYKGKTVFINDDFFKLDIPDNSYDMVLCLGLLAHVNSPEQLLKRLTQVISPGGYLIIQNTDSKHFYSHLIRFYLGLKNLIKKQGYKLNKVSGAFLEQTMLINDFEILQKFRYNQSFLGFSNLFSNKKKYALTRQFFGTVENNKHANFGSDVTYLFRKK